MLKITKNQGSIQVTADKSGFYPFDGTITFPTNSLFTATSANTDMITFKSTSNGDVQFVGNYKDITISGRSYDTKQKFLTAFSNLANQGGGTVDAYTKAETDAKIDAKQNKLKAGSGITLTEDATDGTTVVKTTLSMDRGPFNDDGIKIGRAAELETSSGIAVGDESLSKYGGIAIGYKAKSWGMTSIVIGSNSSNQNGTSVTSGVVIGDNARGVGAGVVIGGGAHGGSAGAVIGYNSTVDGNGYGYAIGDNVHISETTNMVPIAIGYGAEANETKPLAITILKVSDTDGDGNPEIKYCDFIQGDANGKLSILKGDGTDERIVIQDALSAGGSGGGTNPLVNVKGEYGATIPDNVTDAVAIGTSAVSRSECSIAVGNGATSGSGTSNVAIGNLANSSGGSSIAIGNKVETSNINTIAIGTLAGAYIPKSIAIGYNAKASTDTPMVINAGNKTMIQSDSNGKISLLKGDGSDERMVIQDEIAALKNAGGSGGGTNPLVNVKGTGSAIISENLTDAIAIGSDAKVSQENSVAIGSVTKAFGGKSVAVGYQAISQGEFSVGIGSDAKAFGGKSVAVGYQATSNATNGVGIGYGSNATTAMPLVIKAGVDGNGKALPMIQGASNGKISVLLGDGTDTRIVISDEITALKAEITTLKAEIAALKGGASTGA